jgi:site-specific recombinase XerD
VNDFFKAVRDFLEEYLPNQRCFSEQTIRSYKQCLKLLVKYLNEVKLIKLSKITFKTFSRQLILDFLEWLETERQVSISTRNQRLMALRSFFKYAGIADCSQILIGLEVSAVHMKKTQGKIVPFLSEKALETLLSQPDVSKRNKLRDQFFMILMYDTAARCSELLNLRVSDIHLDTKHPFAYLLGKGNKKRIVPILEKTAEHCRHYLSIYHSSENSNPSDFVFYSVIHDIRHSLSESCVQKFMRKYGESARLQCHEIPEKIHPHMLRHTRAVHLYREGMPMTLLSEFLGHATFESTKVYAFADTEMKREAITKADVFRDGSPAPVAVWENDEQMILKLSGLL